MKLSLIVSFFILSLVVVLIKADCSKQTDLIESQVNELNVTTSELSLNSTKLTDSDSKRLEKRKWKRKKKKNKKKKKKKKDKEKGDDKKEDKKDTTSGSDEKKEE